MEGGVTFRTSEHIHIILTPGQKVDNVILTQVWAKPTCGAIQG